MPDNLIVIGHFYKVKQMNKATCKSCIYNVLTTNPNNKELNKNCVRFPPVSHSIPTQQGIAVLCSYPIIQDNIIACGEWDDGADIVIEHSDKMQ